MKNWVLMAVCTAGIWISGSAQVREDRITINGTEHVALRMDMNHDAKLLSDALESKLKESGVKTKSSKGMVTAIGAKLMEISSEQMDYYFRVGPVDKGRSVLYLSISKGYTNFVDPALVPQVWENGKRFMENMVQTAARCQLAADAKEMEKTVRKAEKDYNKAAKQFRKQEDALNKYRQEMEAAQMEWNSKKSELDALQLKIKQ